MLNKKLSPRVVITVVAVVFTSIGVLEWRTLYALDHPPLQRISCVSCHSDAKTLKAMTDKADDPLYLVKRGDLPAHAINASPK